MLLVARHPLIKSIDVYLGQHPLGVRLVVKSGAEPPHSMTLRDSGRPIGIPEILESAGAPHTLRRYRLEMLKIFTATP